MMRWSMAAAMLPFFVFTANAFGQAGNGVLTGTVADVTGAVIPGVEVKAVNTQTGVENIVLTNEAGAYNIPSLLPGLYRLTAALPGFQTQSFDNIELGTNETKRFNFKLLIASVTQQVAVTIDAAQLLATASSSVGEVLPEQRVRDLPIVGNDVLSLIRIMPGVIGETFAGVDATRVNTVRDGLSVSDGRFDSTGVFGTTVINPDLVGEVRLILAPVDAEVGRGNGQVQIQTRSGTNRYAGSVVWNIRNSGLNPNTWGNNNDLDEITGQWKPTVPNWYNQHQITASYGGPIIRNKTFFFALWDQQQDYRRDLITAQTMTETAKKGIFRYWEGWNPGNAEQSATSGTNPSLAAVDFSGNPIRPATNPDGTPYTGGLRCFSVFGNVKVDGSPFTDQDCPGGAAIINASPWDSRRPALDATGYIRRILEAMPTANYFGSVVVNNVQTADGLNKAAFRYIRGRNGVSGGNATIGNDQNQNRRQLNLKIDHHFNASHKVAFNWSIERNAVFSDTPNWPGGISYKTFRNPQVLTVNFISTLSPTLLNEARFGWRYQNAGINAPWEDQYGDNEVIEQARSLMLPGSNGYTALISPGAGNYTFGGTANGLMNTNPGQYNGNRTPLYTYADTLSWTHGNHAFKFGGEIRFTETNGYNNIPQIPFPRVTGGAGQNPANALAQVNAALPGLPQTARGNAANMLYFLSGSVGNSSMLYWINDETDVTQARWEDVNTAGRKFRDLKQNEFAFFAKDDWKITRNLTLNLGVRYEWYGSPFFGSGFTTTAVGQGAGLFGVGRTAGGDLFSNWLQPGNVFLSGYGPNAGAGALQCLPPGCDPNLLTQVHFVGPNTSNPDQTAIRDDWNNFGPAIGFAWQLPWFGEGRTTVRGGYQITYGGSGRNNGGGAADSTEVVIGGAPGALSQANLTNVSELSTLFFDLRDIAQIVPVRPTNPAVPGGALPISARTGGFSAYDPNWTTPYTQNLTLSVTRNVTRNVTLDVRYIGTLSRKQTGVLNPNLNNVYYNRELWEALEITRAGGGAPLFDQMFAGLNLNNGVAGYGPVGTVVNQVLQTGSSHLRRNPAFAGNLANGNFQAVAASLNSNISTFNLPTSGPGALLPLPDTDPATPGTQAPSAGLAGRVQRNGCDRLANGQQTVGPNNSTPLRCFPENFISINPQFGNTTTYITNVGSNNYHSLQAQLTLRPTHGFSFQGAYTWSKNLGIPNDNYTDPTNRRADYSFAAGHRSHDFRTNGTFELPIGPNKFILGNSAGWVARLVERWQLGFITTFTTGARDSIDATDSRWDNGVPDVVGPFDITKGAVEWGFPTTNPAVANGRYFGDGVFMKVPDPQCAGVTPLDNLQANCTIDAVALRNPDGSPGQIVLQNARPGTRGTLGRNTIELPGTYSFDANLRKSFTLTESKSLEVRVDATNVFNHPNPNNPELNINGNNDLGVINGKGNQTRSFQGQVRLNF